MNVYHHRIQYHLKLGAPLFFAWSPTGSHPVKSGSGWGHTHRPPWGFHSPGSLRRRLGQGWTCREAGHRESPLPAVTPLSPSHTRAHTPVNTFKSHVHPVVPPRICTAAREQIRREDVCPGMNLPPGPPSSTGPHLSARECTSTHVAPSQAHRGSRAKTQS